MYDRQGRYKEAEELYRKFLIISKRVLGKEHPKIAAGYNNLAGVYESQGRYKEAINYYLKAYKICKLKLGRDHPNTQISYKNLEMVYTENYPEEDFKQFLEEAMRD
ncbi:MAG: tetratricopeptide repeat protein [Eubacterium sp.]|nr:tetratricopeptide repeat protein [Eubacterium sp.]